MLKKLLFIIILAFIISACSKEEPKKDVFMQVSSITDESGSSWKQITYDSYGRVTSFEYNLKDEKIFVEYEYISDNLIKIMTTDERTIFDGNYPILHQFEDVLHLENGRAVSCVGEYNLTENGKTTLKHKYRHEFNYTPQNYLNYIKKTEWLKWPEDNPWTSEVLYYWENGNITKIEDFEGKSDPYVTFSFWYNESAEVQNVVPVFIGRHQYYPLQLKGIFGSMPKNLIIEIFRFGNNYTNNTSYYKYGITDGRITDYQEIYDGNLKNTFKVQWSM
ncbi:MAG: hypothetical protein K2K25_01395 [Muribaculaceae bacterium]|nr:hypothetical protein [Muribaculaceae bacterium]